MAGLRFRARHVHQTVADYLETELRALGWKTAADVTGGAHVNFRATPCTYIDFQPDEAGTEIAPNTIAITLGDEPVSKLEQIGGGLYSLDFPVFVDIYGDNQAVAQSIGSDVKVLLTDVGFPVKDYTSNPAVPTTELIEILRQDTIGPIKPAVASTATDLVRRFWRVVKATACVYYTEDQ